MASFLSLTVSVADGVGSLVLNRPAKGNSINQQMQVGQRAARWLVHEDRLAAGWCSCSLLLPPTD